MAKRATRWSYNAGERGRNWVRAYEDHRSGIILVESFEPDHRTGERRRQRVSLGHRDRQLAKQQADKMAAGLGELTRVRDADLTLRQLFDKYLCEVTPSKSAGKVKHDEGCARMFLGFLGADRKASTLNVRDWDSFVKARKEGSVGPGSRRKPVGDRQVGYDLSWLLAVLNWATEARNSEGRFLLEANPLRGYKLPKEKNPRRPVLTEDDYRRLLKVAPGIGWRFEVALILAHETGHRIGSIRRLLWNDLDLEVGRIRWRADVDKIGFEHVTPLSGAAVAAIGLALQHRPAIGDTWLLPSPRDETKPCSRHLVKSWWEKAEKRAGLDPEQGRGWHSLRRKFATELKSQPLTDLCRLGGWKDPQTILRCYQTPDEESMIEALSRRQTFWRVGRI